MVVIRRPEGLTAHKHKATPSGGLVVCGARANGLVAPARRLYGGDIYLAHLHHGLEGAPGGLGVGIRDRLGEGQGGDLPGDTPLVLAPAALARLTTVIYDGVPIAIRLGLGLRCDLEREGPAVADPGAAIEP